MTGLELSDPAPIVFYERALHGQRVGVQLEDGTCQSLAAAVWSRPRLGDDSVVERCHGATLDVGCGSGRFTRALLAAGVPALGIDVSPQAVWLTRERGAAALVQNVFTRTPTLGRWRHVLLMDGNIGIDGDAAALLERCHELLYPAGTVIVEAGQPGTGSRSMLLRLVHAGRPSRPFRWFVSDASGIRSTGTRAGLVVTDEWTVDGRWFIELTAADG